jgi:excisionase family DNA binding protein
MHADALARTQTVGGEQVPSDDQIAYRVPHAAKVLDIGLRTMWELLQAGEIESIKIGRSRRIPRSALVAYIERLRGAA